MTEMQQQLKDRRRFYKTVTMVMAFSLVSFLFICYGNVLYREAWLYYVKTFGDYRYEEFQIFIILCNLVTYGAPLLIFMPFKALPYKKTLAAPKKSVKHLWLLIPTVIGGCYAVNIVLGLILNRIGSNADRFFADSPEYPISVAAIILSIITTAVMPAFFEEVMLRGIVSKALLPYGKWFAVITSSVIFAALHVQPFTMVFALCFGLIAGYLYCETGSIWLCVLLHFLNNAMSVFREYAGRVVSDDSPQMMAYGYILLALAVFSLLGYAYYMVSGFTKTKDITAKPPLEEYHISTVYKVNSTVFNVLTLAFLLVFGYEFILRFYS